MLVRPGAHPRIHILGLGSIGTFTAHGLKQVSDPPAWHTPSSSSSSSSYKACGDHINHLIVTVKSTQTVRALRPLKPRLTQSSTILFLQNGCGMVDEVNNHLFPDPATRPNYITGVISHGVTLTAPLHARHTGAFSISLGLVPREDARNPIRHQRPTPDEPKNHNNDDKQNRLQALLPLSPILNATNHPYTTTHQIQLEKLAVNAFCNPVCALHNAPNGILLAPSGPIATLRREILSEISNIVLHLPEFQGVPGVCERFAPHRLEETVLGILERTRWTVCSMVVDVRKGRETEVKFINGYWVRRGREVGVAV
ncbi:ketopantoate reductase PanE/ApbA C terminal-domain-containing protein [Aspergillus venezuelensis]